MFVVWLFIYFGVQPFWVIGNRNKKADNAKEK